ncbi:MAG: hypothetical protein E6G49_12735 [Actinobacteria bacterium]|nr:MAG: hypothetical protein E6G49_12735 [Actinomycetota bacterium]
MTEVAVEVDGQYRVLKEEAGFLDRSPRGKFRVRGNDAADYLQGQLTNDIEALEPEAGCYAALLDRKGHMQADMRVLRLGSGELWLDTEPACGCTASGARSRSRTSRPTGRSCRSSGRPLSRWRGRPRCPPSTPSASTSARAWRSSPSRPILDSI